jgi:hypothetical protein
MVLEALGPAGRGAVGFALGFVEETIRAPEAKARPWAFVEAPETEQLYVPAFSEQMRGALADGRLLWVRAARPKMAEIAQLLLESGLCAGVFLRGLEFASARENAAAWMRRWQLAAEKSGSHLIWIHEKPCSVVGFGVRLAWQKRGTWEIKKGHGLVEGSPWASLRGLVPKRGQREAEIAKGRTDPTTTRVA